MRTPTRPIAVILLLLMLVTTPQLLQAFYRNYAPIHSNFRHDPVSGTDDTPPGLQLSGIEIIRGSTTIADVDGNPGNGKEIVVGGRDGRVYAYHQDGSKLWEFTAVSCTPKDGDDLINTTPAVGDLFGNGTPYVVVGYGPRDRSPSCSHNEDGGVVAINGKTGQQAWRFITPFERMNSFTLNGVLSSPGLADVDNDGRLEIGFGSTNNVIYLLNADGTPRWRYEAWDSIWSSPAFADINGDGRKEMIIGSDFSPANLPPGGPINASGFVYAFDTSPEPDQLREFGQGYLWRQSFDQSIYSSPAIADLDGDGALEIVVGGSCNAPNSTKWVKILDAATGAVKRTLDAISCVVSSPALGDLNGDGQLDIVAALSDRTDGKGRVAAWAADGTLLWSVVALSATGETTDFYEHSTSPVIADLDGNGSLEVAVVAQNSVTILRGDNGQALTTTCTPSARPADCPLKSLFMWRANRTTPAIADLDNDGELELVSGGSHELGSLKGRAFLYAWRDFSNFLNSPSGSLPPYSAPWPMFRGNPQHTGTLIAPRIVPSARQLGTILTRQQQRVLLLRFRNADGSALNWSVTQNDPDNLVDLDRTSGSSADLLKVTIDAPSGLALGTYTPSLTVSANGLPDVTIPITVRVVDQVYDVNLPVTRR
jgi:outer membrane protein assembly factor BamB